MISRIRVYEILGMFSEIDDHPSLLNDQVTSYFVCSDRHYTHTISVNDHRDLMFKLLAFLIWVRWFDSRLFQYLIQTFFLINVQYLHIRVHTYRRYKYTNDENESIYTYKFIFKFFG